MSLPIIFKCIVLTYALLACSIAAGADQTILTLKAATELALTGNPGLSGNQGSRRSDGCNPLTSGILAGSNSEL